VWHSTTITNANVPAPSPQDPSRGRLHRRNNMAPLRRTLPSNSSHRRASPQTPAGQVRPAAGQESAVESDLRAAGGGIQQRCPVRCPGASLEQATVCFFFFFSPKTPKRGPQAPLGGNRGAPTAQGAQGHAGKTLSAGQQGAASWESRPMVRPGFLSCAALPLGPSVRNLR